MSIIDRVFTISPLPELILRWGYYKLLRPFRSGNKKVTKSGNVKTEPVNPSVELTDLIDAIKSLGIKKGDLVVVHSSANGLLDLKANPNELLDSFITLVGESGTIAMPAFPDEDKMKDIDGRKVYDPQKSLAWTGMMPNLMLRKKGNVRSRFPYNPLVAYGPLAAEMMAENLNTDLAHGKGSCWGYCYEHGAKVLFIGLPAYHSNTSLHIVEDYNFNDWLPTDWYEDKEYYIKNSDGMGKKTVRVRKAKWSMYFAERYTEKKYIKQGLIQEEKVGNIEIRYIANLKVFIDSVSSNWKKLKFIYL